MTYCGCSKTCCDLLWVFLQFLWLTVGVPTLWVSQHMMLLILGGPTFAVVYCGCPNTCCELWQSGQGLQIGHEQASHSQSWMASPTKARSHPWGRPHNTKARSHPLQWWMASPTKARSHPLQWWKALHHISFTQARPHPIKLNPIPWW